MWPRDCWSIRPVSIYTVASVSIHSHHWYAVNTRIWMWHPLSKTYRIGGGRLKIFEFRQNCFVLSNLNKYCLTSPPAILCFLVLPPEAPFCPDPQVPENVNASANIYKFTMLSITVSDRDDRLFFLKKVEETQFLRSLWVLQSFLDFLFFP